MKVMHRKQRKAAAKLLSRRLAAPATSGFREYTSGVKVYTGRSAPPDIVLAPPPPEVQDEIEEQGEQREVEGIGHPSVAELHVGKDDGENAQEAPSTSAPPSRASQHEAPHTRSCTASRASQYEAPRTRSFTAQFRVKGVPPGVSAKPGDCVA